MGAVMTLAKSGSDDRDGMPCRSSNLRSLGRAGLVAVLGMLAAPAAMAQCTSPNFAIGSGPFVPFGTGTAVESLISVFNAVNTSSLAQSTAFVSSPSNPQPNQQGGGSWSRVIGGEVETKSNTTTNLLDGTVVNCANTSKVEFFGTQVGVDLARHNFGAGSNFHLGLTAGQFDVTARSQTPGFSFFKGDVEIPFAGIYTAIYAGDFSLDAQVRTDFYQAKISDVTEGLFGQSLNAKSTSFTWNASYRHSLPNNWFIEPSVGGVYSVTEVDPLKVAGTLVLLNNPNFTLPGQVRIDDIESLLARASVRVGTTFVSGNFAYQPFVTASVFHEFAGAVRSSIDVVDLLGTGLTVPGFGSTSTSRVGTYGHIGAGIAGVLLDSGWLGYARLDYRTGENLEGLSVNAGLRYQLQAQALPGGDLKGGGKAAAGLTPFHWTGLYGGWHSGGTKGEVDWSDPTGTAKPEFGGYLIGGHLGYNLQLGHIVLGVEGEWDYMKAKGGESCPDTGGLDAFAFTCRAEVENLAMVTGRVGFTWDRALAYIKGGLAVGDVRLETSYNPSTNPTALIIPVPATGPVNGQDKTLTGWALGAGAEIALNDSWSARAEYMHYDLGKDTFAIDNGLIATGKITGDMVRIGTTYHFGK